MKTGIQFTTNNSSVTPDQFNGDVQAAIDSGENVVIPPGSNFILPAPLVMQNNNQALTGGGKLTTVGAMNTIEISGGANNVFVDVNIDSPLQTSGYGIYVSNASRVRIGANLIDCYRALYAENFNSIDLHYLWGTCRNAGIKLFGNAAMRSDVFNIKYALLACVGYGLDWDGFVHTVNSDYLGINGAGNKGIIIRNTPADAGYPAIGRFNNAQVDYSVENGIKIEAGLDYDFVQPYVLGSTLSGIYIGAAINSWQVRVTGGKSIGNTRYGIENASAGTMLMSGSVDLTNNIMGDVLGVVEVKTPKISIGATDEFSFSLQAGTDNPLITFAPNDYLVFEKATNTYRMFINTVEKFRVQSDKVSSVSSPLNLPAFTQAGLAALTGVAIGDKAFCTNSSVVAAGNFGNIVAGGGVNFVPVYYDGSWRIG